MLINMNKVLKGFSPNLTRSPISITRKFSTQIERTPSDSKRTKVLSFSSDSTLRDAFINPFGELRFGLLLEELDSLAGIVAYRHATDSKTTAEQVDKFLSMKDNHHKGDQFTQMSLPITIVTASVNHIDLQGTLSPQQDLKLDGFVTHVGRSSMEICIKVDALTSSGQESRLVAYFNMVARNPATQTAVAVNSLTPTTPEEKSNYEAGIERARNRKNMSTASLLHTPPTDEERQVIHDLFLKTRTNTTRQPLVSFMSNKNLGPGFCNMASTRFQSTILMQPQEKNIHGKIFGGYLMRKAYELAWSTAYCFSSNFPSCKAVDDIAFLAPVEIGDIVTFTGEVTYNTEKALQVSVAADVINPKTQSTTTTNVFNFTFAAPQELNKKVVPYSYEEAMRFIEGRRKMHILPVEQMKW